MTIEKYIKNKLEGSISENNTKNSVNNLNDSDGIIHSKRQAKNNIKSEKLPKNDLFDELEYFGKKEFLEEIIGVYEISIDKILICTQETVEKLMCTNDYPDDDFYTHHNNSNFYILNINNLQIVSKFKYENFLKVIKLKSGNFLILTFEESSVFPYDFGFYGFFYFVFNFISTKVFKKIKYKKISAPINIKTFNLLYDQCDELTIYEKYGRSREELIIYDGYGQVREELTIYNEISNEQKTFDELIEMENETFLCRYNDAIFRFTENSCEKIEDIKFNRIEEIIIINNDQIIIVTEDEIIKYSLKSKKLINILDYFHSDYRQYIGHKKCFLSKCKNYLIMNSISQNDNCVFSLFIIDISNMQPIKVILKDIEKDFDDDDKISFYYFPNNIFLAFSTGQDELYEFDMFFELNYFNYNDKEQRVPLDSENIKKKYEEYIEKRKEFDNHEIIKLSKNYNFIGYHKSGKIFFCEQNSINIYKKKFLIYYKYIIK